MTSNRFHRSTIPLVGLLLILTTAQVQLASPAKKCPGKADVTIILDSSTSVGDDNWKLQLKFVKNLLAPLNIGPKADRVAFVTYNTEAKVEFNFDKYSTLADVSNAVASATFTEGITATGDALRLAREDILSTARKDASKIVFLVTDGRTNFGEDPVKEAQKIKDLGASIITVGITEEVDVNALKKISSNGKVAQVKDFSKLSTLLKSLAEVTCKEKTKPVKKCKKGSKAEVMIVLDSSTSVGDDNWKLQLDFVKNLLAPLTIGPDADRVGFVTYNTEAKLVFGLGKYSKAADVTKAVGDTTFSEGITATGDALAVAREELNNARKGVPILVFVVTDGKTNWGADPVQEAAELKNLGANIITIGITEDIDEKALKRISSKGKVNSVSEFSQLSSLIESLQTETCETKKPPAKKPPAKKCKKGSKAEVVIVLDSSTSVGDENWKLQLDFVANLLKPLNIGPDADRVGFVTYNTDAKVNFGLDKYSNQTDVLAAVKSTEFTEGLTATGEALKMAHAIVLRAARSGVPKTLFLVTDGRTNVGRDPIDAATNLKEDGVKVVTVGITSDINEDALKKMSSSGKVAKVKEFSQLTSLIESVSQEVCAEKA